MAACGLRRSSTTADPVAPRLRRLASGMFSGWGWRRRYVSRLGLYFRERVHWKVGGYGGQGVRQRAPGAPNAGGGSRVGIPGAASLRPSPLLRLKTNAFRALNSAHLGAMSWPRCLHSHAGLFVCRGTRVLLPEFVRRRIRFILSFVRRRLRRRSRLCRLSNRPPAGCKHSYLKRTSSQDYYACKI